MNKHLAEYPLTPKDATAILQAHLVIRRMEGYSGYKYQYQLFVDGKSRDNQRSDREYQYGIVSISPTDGSVKMVLQDPKEMDFEDLVDESMFTVPVTIKN